PILLHRRTDARAPVTAGAVVVPQAPRCRRRPPADARRRRRTRARTGSTEPWRTSGHATSTSPASGARSGGSGGEEAGGGEGGAAACAGRADRRGGSPVAHEQDSRVALDVHPV